jgi:ribonuclease T1
MTMSKSGYLKQLIGIAAIIGIAFIFFRLTDFTTDVKDKSALPVPDTIQATTTQSKPSGDFQTKIPDYVITVYNYILQNDKAPQGYVGGRIFQNRERHLNDYDENGNKITYREWDVHPKLKGKNRGAERLVTGSDKSAYYTSDHYQTFIKLNP